MNNDISCVFQGLGSIGAIYISNSKAANNLPLLQKLNIKSVITAATGRKIQYPKDKISKYLYLPIEDTEDFKIERYFDQTFMFIEQGRKFTNILIHCHIGASRSVAIVIAYLIKKYHYSLPQIYTLIKRKRSKIEPNPGFIRQLQKYSEIHSVKQDNIHSIIPKLSKVKRSSSLVQKIQQNDLILTKCQIKSEQLKLMQQKRNAKKEIIQQQNLKIQKLHMQRHSIQEKLKKLRQGLVGGTSPLQRQNIRKDKKNQQFSKQNQNIQNVNPNVCLKKNQEQILSKSIEWDGNYDLKSTTSTKIESNLSQFLQKSVIFTKYQDCPERKKHII